MTHLILHSNYQGHIELLYSASKGTSGNILSILFFERIHKLFEHNLPQRHHHYTLFCTDPFTLHDRTTTGEERLNVIRERHADMLYVGKSQSVEFRRFERQDLETALGPVAERGKVVAYVCGPRAMTDWAVDVLRGSKGMEEKRVLCEKWW